MKEQERTEEKNWHKVAPCDAGACVETSEADGFVSVRSSQRPNEVARFTRDEWDAFLAGLRATESAERGEVVGEAAESDTDRISAHDAWNAIAHLKAVTSTIRKHGGPTMMVDTNLLSIALTLAQRAAGSALPPVVQTREEWGYRRAPMANWIDACCSLPVELCAWGRGHTHVRTISTLADDGSPYGGAILTSAWREVSGDG